MAQSDYDNILKGLNLIEESPATSGNAALRLVSDVDCYVAINGQKHSELVRRGEILELPVPATDSVMIFAETPDGTAHLMKSYDIVPGKTCNVVIELSERLAGKGTSAGPVGAGIDAVFITDMDCELLVNGQSLANLSAGVGTTFRLPIGESLVIARTLDDRASSEELLSIQGGGQKVINLKLKEQHDAARQAEEGARQQEEARKRAEEEARNKQEQEARLREEEDQLNRAAPDKSWTEPVTGMEFVWVPEGTFEMGCGDWAGECCDLEKPVHDVRLSGFWLAKYEVTRGQWLRIMGSLPRYERLFCGNRYSGKKFDNHPIACVNWHHTKEFISKLNALGPAKFRLPSEEEWEYAARSGGKREMYAGGDNIDQVAWYEGNSGDSIHEVGTKAPNGLGLYDMCGNVGEWCETVFDGYPNSSQIEPIDYEGDFARVVRGFPGEARTVRATFRYACFPGIDSGNIGFRLAMIG